MRQPVRARPNRVRGVALLQSQRWLTAQLGRQNQLLWSTRHKRPRRQVKPTVRQPNRHRFEAMMTLRKENKTAPSRRRR